MATAGGRHKRAGSSSFSATDPGPGRRSSHAGKGGRPGSAGKKEGEEGHRKPTKISIRDIVDNDSNKRPTAKNLVKGLEDNVRKVLDAKRIEFDRVHFMLGKKKKELAELKLQLADLAKDGKALGLEKYPDARERLKPVKAISTRPVFARDTNLEDMVQQLEAKKEVIQSVIYRGKIYDHMRQRLMTERVEEKALNRDLRAALREQQLRNAEVKRRDIAVSETLGQTQHELMLLKQNVEKDLALWKSEIQDREAWVKQKAQFETFVAKQLQRQREIELEVKGDMGADDEESLKAKSAASMFANRHMAKKLTSTLKSSTGVEKRYEEAFRKIGVKLDNLDPQTVIQTCLAQDEIRKDLLRKREAEEKRVAELTEQLAAAQQELHETEIKQKRTTNRLLADAEKQLNEAEKQLEAEKSEYQFMQATVQPVKIGIQHLANKVLDVQVDLSDVGEIEWVMDQIQARLAKIIEDTRADMSAAGRSGAASPDATSTLGGERRRSLSLAGLSTGAETGEESWLMSPFNVRVKTSLQIEADEENESDSDGDGGGRGGRRRKKGRGKGDDGGIGVGVGAGVSGLGDADGVGALGGDDSESEEEGQVVKSRTQLKREAQKKLTVKLRKSRRGGKNADEAPPRGRRTSTH